VRSSWIYAIATVAAVAIASVLALSQVAEPERVTSQVFLSVDGVHWTPELEEAFFVSEAPWSPGQTRMAVFWVRNEADAQAEVELRVAVTRGRDLADSGLLAVSAVVGDADAGQSFLTGVDDNTVRLGELEPGERTTVALRAVLAGAVDVDSGTLRYAVSASAATAEDPRRALDPTGARLELAPLFLGAGLVLTVVHMRRTRRPGPRSGRGA